MDCLYKMPLQKCNSVELFLGNKLIFGHSGKWLMPLFKMEEFLENYSANEQEIINTRVNTKDLAVHDTAIGKAAAVLMIRMGIKKIHGDIVSKLAVDYIEEYNKEKFSNCETETNEEKIEISWENLVDRLMCATEEELSKMTDIDQMYFRLRQRASLVCGVKVDVRNVSYPFGNIKNISFSLEQGGHLMIIGENGAGKTTLLRLLAGIYRPEKGEIKIDNKNIKKLEKCTIGYIPQLSGDKEDISLSVEEVVSLGLKNKNEEKIKNALERTSSLNLIGRSYNSLSGGEKQKVSISRCLAQNAKLLLLDEPTSALDSENRKIVIDIIRSLTVTEIPTIIISTHQKELIDMAGWQKLNLGDK